MNDEGVYRAAPCFAGSADKSIQYIFLKSNWPANPLPSYITQIYLYFSKFNIIFFYFPTKLF